jgi:hypothetical protein
MIMEHLRGQDVANRLAAVGALSWPLIARVADQCRRPCRWRTAPGSSTAT